MTFSLNWETYKQIPENLRKEFDYKFKERPKTSINIIMNTITVMILASACFMFSIFVLLKEETFTREELMPLFKTSQLLIKSTLIFVITILIIDLIVLILYAYQKHKWLKKHNIKIVNIYLEKFKS